MPVSGTIPPRPRATVRSVLAAHTSACQKPSVRMTNYGLNRLLITHAKEKGRMSTSFCKVNPNFVTWTSIIFCFLQDFLLEYFFKEILLIRLVVTFKKLPPLELFITHLPLNVLSAEVVGIVSRTNCFPLLYETWPLFPPILYWYLMWFSIFKSTNMVKRNYQCLICSMPMLGIGCPGANLETALFTHCSSFSWEMSSSYIAHPGCSPESRLLRWLSFTTVLFSAEHLPWPIDTPWGRPPALPAGALLLPGRPLTWCSGALGITPCLDFTELKGICS